MEYKHLPQFLYISTFNETKDTYSTHIPVFTDSSKENNKATHAVIFSTKCIYVLFTAELTIPVALQYST